MNEKINMLNEILVTLSRLGYEEIDFEKIVEDAMIYYKEDYDKHIKEYGKLYQAHFKEFNEGEKFEGFTEEHAISMGEAIAKIDMELATYCFHLLSKPDIENKEDE